MDSDLVLEVPDTPDRVAKLINGLSQNSAHEEISTVKDEPMMLRHGRRKARPVSCHQTSSSSPTYCTEHLFQQANAARLLSGPCDRKSSFEIEAEYTHDGPSTKNPETVERGEPVLVSYPKNCRDYRKRSVKEISGDFELVENQRRKKFVGAGSSRPPVGLPHSPTSKEDSLLSEGAYAASRARNEEPQGCLFSGPNIKSQHEASSGLPADTDSRHLCVKKLVRNGCISPCNTAKNSSLLPNVQGGLTSSDGNQSSPVHVTSHMKITGTGTKDLDDSHMHNRMQPEKLKTLDISSKSKGKAIADDHLGAAGIIGISSSRPTRRHGLEMNITKKNDDGIFDQEVLVRVEPAKLIDKAHGALLPKGVNIGKDGESSSRRPENLKKVDTRPDNIATIVLDSPESATYHESTRRRSLRGMGKSSTTFATGESSISAPDDSEVSYLGTCLQPSTLRLSGTRNTRSRPNVLRSVIEVDDLLSPEATRDGSRERGCEVSNNSSATNLQVESDELLARQLQEQLYNEQPTYATGIDDEIDAALARSMQQEERARIALSTSRRTNNVYRTRLPSRSSRGLPSRSTLPSRNNQIRSRNSSTRLAQILGDIDLRGMDFDLRLNFFQELEDEYNNRSDLDFSDILQLRRDFTEEDYESLLALDENNHRHTGASENQINNLPQTIMQTNNIDEPCAVCLENPSIGDTIRHLPCLHKFHKDCIDEWLRRKTSCPVCKISVT